MRECSFNGCTNKTEEVRVINKGGYVTANNRRQLCGNCLKRSQEYRKGKGNESIFSMLVGSARERSKTQEVPFDISPYYIASIWPTDWKCPILKRPFVAGKGSPGRYSASLDKIKPELGYVEGNVQVICRLANLMKQDADEEDLRNFSRYYADDPRQDN